MAEPAHRLRAASVCLWAVLFLPGCSLLPRHSGWAPPVLAEPVTSDAAALVAGGSSEQSYAEAARLELLGDEVCVDRYYESATRAWFHVTAEQQRAGGVDKRHWDLYHSAVTRLLVTARQFGRLTTDGLFVATADGVLHVPIEPHDFPWSSGDFRVLFPVGAYPSDSIKHVYRSEGWGVPVVASATARARPLMLPNQVFAATVLLRPIASRHQSAPAHEFKLEFRNPLYCSTASVGGQQVPLARDITAPIAFLLDRDRRDGLSNFLRPGASQGDDGLHMLEPYQPGKIPIIFLHGLLSDPTTWADLGNELRGRAEVLRRYQLWAFRYPTGEPFLKSAATLRRQLREAQAVLDPSGQDTSLRQMVLIGHSMGGLVARLQVSHSGDALWSAVAKQPLGTIRSTPEAKQDLADAFFFEPSPAVSRAVFIGTPHRGSGWAQRLVGRLGSALVEVSQQTSAEHRRLMQDNPGVFSREVQRRIPTSIDLSTLR